MIAYFTLKCMNIFRKIWQFMTSLPKVLPPAIFILSDLLCKAANLSIVFFCQKEQSTSALCYVVSLLIPHLNNLTVPYPCCSNCSVLFFRFTTQCTICCRRSQRNQGANHHQPVTTAPLLLVLMSTIKH